MSGNNKEEVLRLALIAKQRKLFLTKDSTKHASFADIGRIFNMNGDTVEAMARRYIKKNGISTDAVATYLSDVTDIKEEEVKKNLVDRKEGKEEVKPKFVDCGDYYQIYGRGKRIVEITKDKLRQLKALYCDDKNHLSINQICLELDMPRRDFMLIKYAFSITHDDVPFIDEDIENGDLEELSGISLERKKAKFFVKLQANEVEYMKKELEKYRKLDYRMQKISELSRQVLESTEYRRPESFIFNTSSNAKLLEVPIVDVHLNKMAWNQETGEDYDSKIAEKRFKETINKVHDRIDGYQCSKILFPIGNDFFNIDTPAGTTYGGTKQDIDGRWAKMYVAGVNMLIWAIEELRTHMQCPVYAFLVPGNHDLTTSFSAINTVAAYFHTIPDQVTVDINPQTRKYVWFGNNLIGFTHLDKEKKRIEGNMQYEAPEAWGNTKYREWHGGHLHSEQTKEANGITIRNLSSFTGTDYWHYTEGYVGAIAQTQIFVWDKEEGLWDQKYVKVQAERKNHIIKI